MLMRTDPFRELDRVAAQLLGTVTGTPAHPNPMPMDAFREGDQFVVCFDLPGISLEAIDLDIERNVLTVKAERRPVQLGEDVEMQVSERPVGVFSRQLFLGETLDVEHIAADYRDGVLTLRIPVAPSAEPRRIEITSADEPRQLTG